MPTDSPERQFACDTVDRLRDAGYDALWAGGCVRDELLGRTPKDYDVATSATPEEVIALFGKRRTVAVGASFGVVMVLGPRRECGQIEVATFRADGDYLDGRRPESVSFCSAEEDARRRDFTINGMFFDPRTNQVIDYVNGQTDLNAGLIRAIGDPRARFQEDKLRVLRAVRFAATFAFELEAETATAVKELASQLTVVSVERIAQELRRMLAHPTRSSSVQWLLKLNLAVQIPGLDPADWPDADRLLPCLNQLQLPRFETSMACLMTPQLDWASTTRKTITAQCRQLKLSNEEADCIQWLIAGCPDAALGDALALSRRKPLLHDERAPLLLDLLRATGHPQAAEFLQQYRTRTNAAELNPPPLITGQDLMQLGHQPGPQFKQILAMIRDEQLDERLTDRDAALRRVAELWEEDGG